MRKNSKFCARVESRPKSVTSVGPKTDSKSVAVICLRCTRRSPHPKASRCCSRPTTDMRRSTRQRAAVQPIRSDRCRGVLLLALLQLPLAWRLSTRIQRDQVAKQRLLEAAVEASDVERKRIAADLHDGVVQDLTGVTFTLAAMTNSFEPGDARAESVETAAAHTRNAVTALRSLLVEIYPPNLRDAGIESALGGLFRRRWKHVAFRLR